MNVRAHHPVNVDRLIPVIYVYCDLIERQQVGDSYVQLLRTLPTQSGVWGDLITETFDNIHYGGVERGSFEMVETSSRPPGYKYPLSEEYCHSETAL